MPAISVKSDPHIDAANAYTVTVDGTTYDVHTNSHGKGLWIDGKQIEGTGQFEVGSNPAQAIRRYFQKRGF